MQSNSSCQTCKTRRIKCDGAKPICQKCIKSRRTCVEADAAKQQQFAIHIENQYAAGDKRRPRGPRSSLVPINANLDLKTRAHAYYVQNHFQVFRDMPGVVTTWAECLHEWKAEGKTSPIVDLAFSAVALSVFARFQNCRPAAAEASKSYLSLLRHMQNRIPRLSSGNASSDEIDEYLLGAHFMARYEAFVQNHGDEADLEPLKEVKQS
ncbi:Zn(2)-C6 fungal-type domain-containing protein [Fusarium falciforme]|uniref:Zn(2)-C6 fungal-type domain-containing protein n=1 Tax=Fusarium falciforme TaxID=195108 RepID=UPI002300F223|nr:Zn(2)-C6 fungal-type domain-containing protein [Fusarium falciforme]WAO89267.1 Zn(2)-C6 fungal-type domain-containing protein [Fusarium falciforme]